MLNITDFFATYFTNFIWLAVFILALLPITEGRVAFLFAINKTLLNNMTLSPILALFTCLMASIFLTLFLLVFFNSLCKILKKIKLFNNLLCLMEGIVERKSLKIKEKNAKYFYLFLFVLIPLPLTGVWSASLISSFLNLNYIKSAISIILGNLGSLIVLYLLNLGFKDLSLIILIVVFLIVLLFILIKKLLAKMQKH